MKNPPKLTGETVAEHANQALQATRPAAESARRDIATMPKPSLIVERLAEQYAHGDWTNL